MKAGVLIPTFNRRRLFEVSLGSALARAYPGIEIIAVDNGSSDGTAEYVRGLVDPCRPERIAETLRALSASPVRWRELSATGRDFVEKNIIWQIYARRIRGEMACLRGEGKNN